MLSLSEGIAPGSCGGRDRIEACLKRMSTAAWFRIVVDGGGGMISMLGFLTTATELVLASRN
jgi:hypothetical protein